jgi:hypothetical protein
MFEKRSAREVVFWIVLFYVGWTLTGLFSQSIHLDDSVVRISYDMGHGHWTPSMMAVNALTEFNCGIIFIYLICSYLNHKLRSLSA